MRAVDPQNPTNSLTSLKALILLVFSQIYLTIISLTIRYFPN